ncbi:MAG: AAA family ATPase [Acidobacteriales bacterium]|nr:AAA family ATPase [Terriglobales bacterium]
MAKVVHMGLIILRYNIADVGYKVDLQAEFVHLARLALDENPRDLAAVLRRTLQPIVRERPDLADLANRVLARAASDSLIRSHRANQPLPVDMDSRLELLRSEPAPEISVEPTWPEQVARELTAVLAERKIEAELRNAGVPPTRSLLLVGPPGVGKTLAARWIARQLGRPLLTLDLAAVMSSFLGRTGNNIRTVLDYAQQKPSVLLLDEFDAIAKRRDDAVEVGELKRLVTVLLQTIDDWPMEGLLVGATNHPDLLDPAVWRRFDRIIQFPLPSIEDAVSVLNTLLATDRAVLPAKQVILLGTLFQGKSFADITRAVLAAKRSAIVNHAALPSILDGLVEQLAQQSTIERRIDVARALQSQGMSQRSVSRVTGLSRDTIRKRLSTTAHVPKKGAK